jgi:hypothetical protein
LLKNVGRRLYATKDGHIGLGPGEMQTGDCVVVFPGSTVPHIIRPVGEGEPQAAQEKLWTYIGEAYCEGIMEGQAVGKPGVEMETFTLV